MSDSQSPEEMALKDIPEAWFERGRVNAFIPAWLGGLAAGYALKYSGIIEPNFYVEAATGLAAVASASLLDRKSSQDLLSSMEGARQSEVDYHYIETNELVGAAQSREDFIRSTRSAKIIGLEAVCTGIACLGWPFAAPITAIRGIAAMNNRRKTRRINKAVEYAQITH